MLTINPGPTKVAELETPEPIETTDDLEIESDEDDTEDTAIDFEPADIDDANDRLYSVELVGKRVHGLYEGSGTLIGTHALLSTTIVG